MNLTSYPLPSKEALERFREKNEANTDTTNLDEQEQRESMINYIKSTEAVVPDSFILDVAKSVGVSNYDPLVIRGAGLLAEQRVMDILDECLMLIRVRGEGRVNPINKDVTYVLTKEIVEEVITMKHLPHPLKKK